MPVFHTKTIESILEPVAQQVSEQNVVFPKCLLFHYVIFNEIVLYDYSEVL